MRTFLYMSGADVQVMYTPPLYSTPQLVRRLGQDSAYSLVAGHSIEASFSNSFTIFVGQDQVSIVQYDINAHRVCRSTIISQIQT